VTSISVLNFNLELSAIWILIPENFREVSFLKKTVPRKKKTVEA